MDNLIFQKEDNKYSALWMNGYKDAHWKRLAEVGLKLSKSIGKTPSLIDFGFGKGSTMDFFEKKGMYVEGVEISEYASNNQKKKGRKVYHTSLDNLTMIKNNEFNIGFCNDVIEHIPEELITPSLDEMVKVCSDYLLVSVCPTPSHHLSLNGENLHLTVKPESWWEKTFQNYGEVKKVKFLFSRSARYVINLN